MLSEVQVTEDILSDSKYLYLFTVEEVNRLVLKGVPFRDAYRQVGEEIERGSFKASSKVLTHTHEGSIGNLCTEQIRSRFAQILARFPFAEIAKAQKQLLAKS